MHHDQTMEFTTQFTPIHNYPIKLHIKLQSQRDYWTYTQGGSSFFPLRWRVGWCENGNFFSLCSHYVFICRFQEDNIGQSILDKMKCYLEHVEEHLGNLGNMFITQSTGNIMRTSCEHIENKIIQIIQTPTHTFPKRIKTGMFGACCNSSLAEQKFQLCSSPILA